MQRNDPDEWLANIANAMGSNAAQQEVHAKGLAFLIALRALPAGGYREKAECMLGDALVMAFAAAR